MIGTILKLLATCLIVGLILSWLGLGPLDLLRELGGRAHEFVEAGKSFFAWAWRYIVVGAAIVIPVWLLIVAIRFLRRCI